MCSACESIHELDEIVKEATTRLLTSEEVARLREHFEYEQDSIAERYDD